MMQICDKVTYLQFARDGGGNGKNFKVKMQSCTVVNDSIPRAQEETVWQK